MSICPDHGGYTGDACKKCQGEPQEVKSQMKAATATPKLDSEDKFTLVKLENDAMKAFHKMQNAQAQLQNFANGMFAKYEVDPKANTLDMEKLEFVPKGM